MTHYVENGVVDKTSVSLREVLLEDIIPETLMSVIFMSTQSIEEALKELDHIIDTKSSMLTRPQGTEQYTTIVQCLTLIEGTLVRLLSDSDLVSENVSINKALDITHVVENETEKEEVTKALARVQAMLQRA